MTDPIIEEVRRIREEHAAKFNYDPKAIFADLKRYPQEEQSEFENICVVSRVKVWQDVFTTRRKSGLTNPSPKLTTARGFTVKFDLIQAGG